MSLVGRELGAVRDTVAGDAFPAAAMDLLERTGVLASGATDGSPSPPAADELAMVRLVAAVDASVGRILDGHLNAVERLAVQGPEPLRTRELAAVRRGELRAGVWGADPEAGEGMPARLHGARRDLRLSGVKTFCSGAGALHRALVVAQDPEAPEGPRQAAWVDLTDGGVTVDIEWFRSGAMRASHSHRVVFDAAPVLGLIGSPGALVEEPWLSRDALRTTATWAGCADTIAASGLRALRGRDDGGELAALAAGRLRIAIDVLDVWLAEAAVRMDRLDPGLRRFALAARTEIARACRQVADVAAQACGTGLFVRDPAADAARRDLELFVVQHRLDPLVARAGRRLLEGQR